MSQMNPHPAAEKVTEIISHGLVSGWGEARPGELCIEAAICLALGEPHEQKPSCVGEPQHSFAMKLNDSSWSSRVARGKGMLPYALAELGTIDFTDAQQRAFCNYIILEVIRRILPKAFRIAAALHPVAKHRLVLEQQAALLETTDAANAAYAAYAAATYATYAANAANAAYAAAANAANAAATYATYAANAAASYASNAAAYAADATYATYATYAYAANAADAADAAAANAADAAYAANADNAADAADAANATYAAATYAANAANAANATYATYATYNAANVADAAANVADARADEILTLAAQIGVEAIEHARGLVTGGAL